MKLNLSAAAVGTSESEGDEEDLVKNNSKMKNTKSTITRKGLRVSRQNSSTISDDIENQNHQHHSPAQDRARAVRAIAEQLLKVI